MTGEDAILSERNRIANRAMQAAKKYVHAASYRSSTDPLFWNLRAAVVEYEEAEKKALRGATR